MRYSLVYNKMKRLGKNSKLTKRDIDAFYAAYEQALKSDFGTQKLGCVLLYGNQIIGRGFNTQKSDPQQKYYNLSYRNFYPGYYSNREHSLHAEIYALKSVPYSIAQSINWKRVKAYVYRISPGLPLEQGTAAPCCACAHALADAGIEKVYFSTDYGFGFSYIDEDAGLLSDIVEKESE